MIQELIGLTGMTNNKWARSDSLAIDPILRFVKKSESFFVVTKRTLSATEMSTLISNLENLPDVPIDDDKIAFDLSPFKNMTPTQAEEWIETNVIDFDTSKSALKKIINVVITLVRKTDLNE